MNDHPSPIARADDDTPPSPKRKKVRAKYAPKACVSCRRSKLKCSGENPCQRCVDNGKRCFYSEDQTAAEALQNLSRPAPVQTPLSLLNSNGHGTTRRSILPRHEGIERRASDASVLGLSMEARMQRIETMMEALVQDRGMTMTPRGSIEREEAVSESFQGESSFHAPTGEPFGPNLVPVRQQLSFPHESPERTRQSASAASPSSSADSTSTLRLGSRNLTFPNQVDYQKYIDFFFAEIHPFHPCINETEFRTRMLVSRSIHPSEVCFLALNYIIFACSDSLVDTTPPNVNGKPPGWQWFILADELVGKRSFAGRGDLSLLQFLLLEAIYFTTIDKPNLAYNTISLAARSAFQYGLHQQSSLTNLNHFQAQTCQRIFWTIYVTDRRISLSSGRPYSIRDLDLDIQGPSYAHDRDILAEQSLSDHEVCRSTIAFQASMVYWARMAGELWDRLFSASVPIGTIDGEIANLDARLKHFYEKMLPPIPLISNELGRQPEVRQLRQHVIVYTVVNHLRLLLRRRTMLSLQYDDGTARLCGNLALDTISRIRVHAAEAKHPSAFRHHITSAAAIALLTLCTLLVRDPSTLKLSLQAQQAYIDGFRDAISILHDLSLGLQFARRVVEDFRDIIGVVGRVTDTWQQCIGTPAQMQGWDTVKGLIPSNVIEFFPYRELDAGTQSGIPPLDMSAGQQGTSWNGSEVASGNLSLEGWDFELATKETGHGVPWM